MIFQPNHIPYQSLLLTNTSIAVKRLDLVHPTISGNKFYKLKYNLMQAKQQGYQGYQGYQRHQYVVSFGGAYSNHIYALAHACHEYGFESVGIIRGQELAGKTLNPSLQKAQDLGMKLDFINRSDYRNKHTPEFMNKLLANYPNAYIIPEGGTNQLAIKGCEEILSDEDKQNYDIIALAVGTGGTIAGIINSASEYQQIIGFNALNSDYQQQEIQQYLRPDACKIWKLIKDDKIDGFGGYGKYNDELLQFIHQIKETANIPLEPIYTGKAMYRLVKMIEQGQIDSNKRILFLHTGGLQTAIL